jgi:hypothetical protein
VSPSPCNIYARACVGVGVRVCVIYLRVCVIYMHVCVIHLCVCVCVIYLRVCVLYLRVCVIYLRVCVIYLRVCVIYLWQITTTEARSLSFCAGSRLESRYRRCRVFSLSPSKYACYCVTPKSDSRFRLANV